MMQAILSTPLLRRFVIVLALGYGAFLYGKSVQKQYFAPIVAELEQSVKDERAKVAKAQAALVAAELASNRYAMARDIEEHKSRSLQQKVDDYARSLQTSLLVAPAQHDQKRAPVPIERNRACLLSGFDVDRLRQLRAP